MVYDETGNDFYASLSVSMWFGGRTRFWQRNVISDLDSFQMENCPQKILFANYFLSFH